MAKKVLVRQYVEMVRTIAVIVENDEDIEVAASIANTLPISADAVSEDIANVISDWEYIQDSDDFEDADGNPISV